MILEIQCIFFAMDLQVAQFPELQTLAEKFPKKYMCDLPFSDRWTKIASCLQVQLGEVHAIQLLGFALKHVQTRDIS